VSTSSEGHHTAASADRSRIPEGLIQFTPGYFQFHAQRLNVRSTPYQATFLALAGVVVLAFTLLVIWSMLDLALG
jgi:hypothetical protein